ncbi:MAG: PIN domain-containing protein [Chloroflexota bacterium]
MRDFEEWYTDFVGLFPNPTRDEDVQLKRLYFEMDSWIKYRKDKEIPDSVNTATALFGATCEKFIDMLNQLTPSGGASSILVIDTSAIIDCPDVSQMSILLNMSGATFIFPSTTISELDDLKKGRRDENFRRRLTAAISNLNEIMTKGNVLEGIALPNNIIVKMLAVEPDFSRLPKWLDPQINDDRILASAIELQRSNPNSSIAILANDINMQNKATLAGMPVMKVPDSFETAA